LDNIGTQDKFTAKEAKALLQTIEIILANSMNAQFIDIVDSHLNSNQQWRVIAKVTLSSLSNSISTAEQTLTASITSNQFTSVLQAVASANNVTQFQHASAMSMEYDSYDSLSSSTASSSSSSKIINLYFFTLDMNMLIVVLVGGLVVILFIMLVVTLKCFYKNKHGVDGLTIAWYHMTGNQAKLNVPSTDEEMISEGLQDIIDVSQVRTHHYEEGHTFRQPMVDNMEDSAHSLRQVSFDENV